MGGVGSTFDTFFVGVQEAIRNERRVHEKMSQVCLIRGDGSIIYIYRLKTFTNVLGSKLPVTLW